MNYTKQQFHIQLNMNSEFANEIMDMIKKNDGYCINAIEKTPETKCMCKEFRECQEEGFCKCKLYAKISNYDIE